MTQVLEKIGAGEGNRTLVISLEGFCSTIELHPRLRNATAAAEYNIVCAAAKIAFAFPVAERHHGLGTWVAEARL